MSEQASLPSSSETTSYEVHYKDWKTSVTINEPSTGKQLYILHRNESSRACILKDGSGLEVGSTKRHSMTSKIDIETSDSSGSKQTFGLEDDKWLSGSPAYSSPAFNGQKMTWKHNGALESKIGYTLIDGTGLAIANFESNRKTKIGTLVIQNNAVNQEQLNEIALIILTLLRRKLSNVETSTIVAIT